jgi:hypothetical protein
MITEAGGPLKTSVQHRVVECSRLRSAPSIPQRSNAVMRAVSE